MLNDQDSQVIKNPPSTIDNEMREWPESVYLKTAVAEAKGKSVQPRDAQKADKRRGALLWTMLLVVLVIGGGLALWWYLDKNRLPPKIGQSGPSPSPPLISSIDPKDIEIKVAEPNNRDNHRVTEATIKSAGQDILKLVKYEFYSSKFIVNNTSLKNERELVSIFKGIMSDLSNSWILIFASASLEGDVDYNTDLCNRRIYRVRDLIAKDVGVTTKGYWGILAGEYKMRLPGLAPEEEEENNIARERGEKWLEPQRKLIIITIKELQPIAPEDQSKVPSWVSKRISAQDMLPKTYDAPESEPFSLQDNGEKR
jgi:hypothetical protein